MKKILLSMMLLTSSITQAENNELNLHLNMTKTSYGGGTYDSFGPTLLMVGGAFILGGLLTQIPYDGLHGKDKPFFEQGPRMHAILGGSVLVGTGFIITIGRR